MTAAASDARRATCAASGDASGDAADTDDTADPCPVTFLAADPMPTVAWALDVYGMVVEGGEDRARALHQCFSRFQTIIIDLMIILYILTLY